MAFEDDEQDSSSGNGEDGKWMQKANSSIEAKGTKGKLRKKLGVKEGEKIPIKKLDKAADSSSPILRKEANLAKTFRKFSPAAKGSSPKGAALKR